MWANHCTLPRSDATWVLTQSDYCLSCSAILPTYEAAVGDAEVEGWKDEVR